MKKLTRRITQAITGAATAATLLAGRTLAVSADPASTPVQEGADAVRAEGMPEELKIVFSDISRTILFVVGIISVVMLIYGGVRYIISGGDSKKVTDAKNTILYAIIGLIVAVLSFAIVNFVINAIGGSSTPAPAQ